MKNTNSLINLDSDTVNQTELIKLIESRIFKHPTLNHKLFKYLKLLSKSKTLTSEQFGFFRHIIFSRVYLTIPSITVALKSAILQRNKFAIKTCYENLSEELSIGQDTQDCSHVELMELAFNTIGEKCFGLSNTDSKTCFDNPVLSQELIYRYTISQLYKDAPIVVSLSQELSSGGFNNQSSAGMMEDIYQIFLEILFSNQNRISKNEFTKNVLPYFSAHLSIGSDLQIIHDGMGTEFNHGERAKEDYLKSIINPSQITKDIPYFMAFLDAQNMLFNSTLEIIEALNPRESVTLL